MLDLSIKHAERINAAEAKRKEAFLVANEKWVKAQTAALKMMNDAESARDTAIQAAMEAFSEETNASALDLAGQMQARFEAHKERLLEAERMLNGDDAGKPETKSELPPAHGLNTATPEKDS